MIDDRAARGFEAAAHYDAYRPSYPPEAIAFIREAGRLDERSTLVDLGAGTGLMTRLLLPVGRLIAIEPVPEMRNTLLARVAGAEAMDGTAEDIPLPSATADAVVVAQAFHWFANSQALSEIARVLKPDGALIPIWNVKDPRDPVMEELDAILAPYRLSSPGFASTPWREVFETGVSPLRLVSHETFSYQETLALRQLKGRVLSTSYITLLEERLQAAVLLELERLVGSAGDVKAADDAPITMRYQTEVFVARHAKM
jgi:SAM-dependent methyltransferase